MYHIYGIGNALVDLELEVTDSFLLQNNIKKGAMTLVDEARQKDLMDKVDGIQHRRCCGGSAANTIIASMQLGAKSFYSCKVANDEMGEFYTQDLARSGVKSNLGPKRPAGSTGKCMVFITGDAERTMNTFLGITETFSTEELVASEISKSQYLYIEGYLLSSATGRPAVQKAMQVAKEAGVKTSLTFSDAFMVQVFGEHFREILKSPVDLLFCNENEARAFTNKTDMNEVFEELKKYAKTFAITMGPKGARIFDGHHEIEVLAPMVQAIDTTGAGDVFAGVLMYGLTHGFGFAQSGRAACAAASLLVTQFGSRLKDEQILKIKEQFFK
jgi:sugar/nucleoside kinase (ribokinase family)